MNTVKQFIRQIETGAYDHMLTKLYGADAVSEQRVRYQKAAEAFGRLYGMDREISLFSAPGRTEIGGNHTDHNHGCVLAASVNLDVISVASKSHRNCIRVQSEGYPQDVVMLDDLNVKEKEKNKSSSLIRGTAHRFQQQGLSVGGFDAYTTSNVLKGSGMSSSAAFEVLIGTIFNTIFNGGKISAVDIAKTAQYAENIYFGKPCGLMDQMASSVGGIIFIDFADPEAPITQKVNYDFARTGYRLCIVDTGGNHSDLTPEYAAIPAEMKAVAASLGVSVMRETTKEKLMSRISELRKRHGDRAVLRALHFLQENERVLDEVSALKADDFDEFKRLVIESGESSFQYLQNVFPSSRPQEQGLSLALFLAEEMLKDKGAWRVHGGGFAGTTQNFVPGELLEPFKEKMEQVFGSGSCHVLTIRPYGGVCVDTLQ